MLRVQVSLALCALTLLQSRIGVTSAQGLTGALEEPEEVVLLPQAFDEAADTQVSSEAQPEDQALPEAEDDGATASDAANAPVSATPGDPPALRERRKRSVIAPPPLAIDASQQCGGQSQAPEIPPPAGLGGSGVPAVSVSAMYHKCGCSHDHFIDDPAKVQSLRDKSNKWLADGDASAAQGWSNFIWSWGQWIDHDLTGTIDDPESETYIIDMVDEATGETRSMHLDRVKRDGDGKCSKLQNALTPLIDAGPVYGQDADYLKKYMREPDSCRLITSAGDLLPTTSGCFGTTGNHRFVAGDRRVNEHSILTAMHTVWLREHNRLCDAITADPELAHLSHDDQFAMARSVIAAKMQMITLHEFLPLLGIHAHDVEHYESADDQADISVEFLIAYRLHDLIPNTIGNFSMTQIFNGEAFFGILPNARDSIDPDIANAELARLVTAVAGNPSAAMDGKFPDALRNMLFGMFGQDLGTRNMYRSKEIHMRGYKELARCYNINRKDAAYWRARSDNMLAGGDVPFLALARENAHSHGPIGPVTHAILKDQFHRSIFGPNGLWWRNDEAAVGPFKSEIENVKLSHVLNANVKGVSIKEDAFKV